MKNEIDSASCNANCTSPAEQLNLDCFCTTLDRKQLDKILRQDDINQDILNTHPQLFSNTTVFISSIHFQQMQTIVQAVSRVARLPAYEKETLARAPAIAAHNPGTSGVFMGYDFHLSENGPQVIEINTNAGGGFLNSVLLNAQTACCRVPGAEFPSLKAELDQEFLTMFLHEWSLQRGNKQLQTVAIVDENPEQQFLFPEFKMAQRLFESNGIKAIIVDPRELHFSHNQLTCNGLIIDLVYNRLTDFSLAGGALGELRSAFEAGAVVLTPNPHHHALYADKRNLVVFSDAQQLENLGVAKSDIEILCKSIPHTQPVTSKNAEDLWLNRKHLFFKPAAGFGSRATYRGDKLTKRVWDEILQGDYIAQKIVMPSERGIKVDEQHTALKLDIRAYVYETKIQLLSARLYQGQTTNFRTQGAALPRY